MTKGRKSFLGIVLLSFCFCPAVNAQGGSLDELLETQKSALKTLEQKLAGQNPYLQWRAAQKALKRVTESAENVARTSRRIERERVDLAGDNRQLASVNETLLKEVQGLKRSNTDLARANENLASGKKQLLVQNERLVSRQRFFWMAFYSALALAFLGFGGLLVRIPNSRLERRLKRLEIRELETRLKKEANRSRAETSRQRPAARPMAERRNAGTKPSQAEPPGGEAQEMKVEPIGIQEAPQEKAPVEPLVLSDDAPKEDKVVVREEATKPGEGENGLKKKETMQKQKQKKKRKK